MTTLNTKRIHFYLQKSFSDGGLLVRLLSLLKKETHSVVSPLLAFYKAPLSGKAGSNLLYCEAGKHGKSNRLPPIAPDQTKQMIGVKFTDLVLPFHVVKGVCFSFIFYLLEEHCFILKNILS